MKNLLTVLLIVVALLLGWFVGNLGEFQTDRISMIKERGYLNCGAGVELPGFGFVVKGEHVGFDVSICRAVAIAVLGDKNAITITNYPAKDREAALDSGDVDLIINTTTKTSSREISWGNFLPVLFYDGQGFMTKRSTGINNLLELKNKKVCVAKGTTTFANLKDFSKQNKLDITPVLFDDFASAVDSYENGGCDAFTTDTSVLVATQTTLSVPSDHILLQGTISEEPLSPIVPHGDENWYALVNTVISILIQSEAYGINSQNIPTVPTENETVNRLLGFSDDFGQEALGLKKDIARDIISTVGNYGEIFARNFQTEDIYIPRDNTRNALWNEAPCQKCPKGGQIYSSPLR